MRFRGVNRRGARDQTKQPESTLSRAFRALFTAQDSRFDASRYTVDGVTGKIASFTDYVDPTHSLVQTTSANQAALPSADAALNGANSATFITTWYDSNRAASAWQYLHDGSGCTAFFVYVPTGAGSSHVIMSTAGGTNNGIRHFYTVGSTVTTTSWNGTSAVLTASPALPTAMGVGTFQSFNYLEGAPTPEFEQRIRSVVSFSGDSTAAPSATPPQGTLRIGANVVDNTFNAAMRFRASYFFGRVLTADERAIVHQWIQGETGLS